MTELLVSLPWAVLCGGLLYALVRVIRDSATERAQLLQRIQAPDQAVIEHAAQPSDRPLYVPWDDDEAFHASKDVPE